MTPGCRATARRTARAPPATGSCSANLRFDGVERRIDEGRGSADRQPQADDDPREPIWQEHSEQPRLVFGNVAEAKGDRKTDRGGQEDPPKKGGPPAHRLRPPLGGGRREATGQGATVTGASGQCVWRGVTK